VRIWLKTEKVVGLDKVLGQTIQEEQGVGKYLDLFVSPLEFTLAPTENFSMDMVERFTFYQSFPPCPSRLNGEYRFRTARIVLDEMPGAHSERRAYGEATDYRDGQQLYRMIREGKAYPIRSWMTEQSIQPTRINKVKAALLRLAEWWAKQVEELQ